VKSKSVFAAVGVLAAALVVWLWSGQGDVPSVTAREAAGGPAQTREQELASDPAPIPTRVPVLEAPREEPNGPPVQVPDEAIHVVGSVRDREGRPIPGAHVLAKMHAGTACTTDAGGAFRLPSAIRLGTKLILQVRCPRYLATEVDVVVRIESPTVVELDRAPRISGTLVDPRGEPIEGYRLQALSDADKPLAFGITDSAGKFDLCRKDSNPDGFVTVSEMYTYGHGMLVDRPRVAWGTEDLELRARSSGEFELRVTRGDDGAPVTAFAVCLLHAEHQGPQGWDPRRPVRVASDEGVTRVRCIPGPVSAIVIPDDLDLQPSTTVAVEVPENGTTIASVTLAPGPVQRVHVIDRQTGLGVAGAMVRIVVGGSDAERRSDATLPGVAEALGIRMLTWPRTGIVAKATTDANGVATVRAAAPAALASIECEHPDYQPASVRLATETGPVDLQIALDRGMLIRGVVEPGDMLRFRPYVRTSHQRAGKDVLGKWVAVDQQAGSFELIVAAAGDVRLDLALPSAGIGSAEFGPVPTAIGIGRVAAGTPAARGEERVVLAAGAYLPGSAAGSVFVDGVSPAIVRMHPVRDGVAHPGWAGETLVSPDGNFVVEPLLVGDWWFSAAPRTDGMRFQYLPVFFAECIPRPGERLRVTGNVMTLTTEMTVADAAGAPLAEGQDTTLALQRCPLRRYSTKLGPGGVLRVPGVVATETVQVRVVGGPLDKQTGEAPATARQVTVR
jgi:hypothetical protein